MRWGGRVNLNDFGEIGFSFWLLPGVALGVATRFLRLGFVDWEAKTPPAG